MKRKDAEDADAAAAAAVADGAPAGLSPRPSCLWGAGAGEYLASASRS